MVGQMKQLNKIKLHLGCGNKHIDGFINIDIRKVEGVDIVDDVTKLESFSDNTIDLIYVSHVLEHFGRFEYTQILEKWYKLLKPQGTLRIAVPDFEKIVEHYLENKNLFILRGLLYGGQDYAENFHYCTWDFQTLSDDLTNIGFSSIKRYNWQDTEHFFIDDYSQSYLPHMDKKNGKLMSLNIEAIK
jgi:predicted SAM-dependent methyltransferase